MAGKITRQELSEGLKSELNKSGILSELETSNKANLVGAINEVDGKVKTHLADIASQEIGKGADIIGLPDPNNLFTATNVGGAMQELFTNVSNGKTLVGGAITDVDENVVIPTDATFNDLASAIGKISTGKKWASGNADSGSVAKITVTGIGFQPSLIVVDDGGMRASYVQYSEDERINTIMYGGTVGAITVALKNPFILSTDGFTVGLRANKNHSWIAFE